MVRLFHPLLFLLARSTPDDLHKQVEFLKAENEMLRRRVPNKRIFFEPAERAKLLKLNKEVGTGVRQPSPAANRESPHAKPIMLADIKCQERLGGLLKHFHRDAA